MRDAIHELHRINAMTDLEFFEFRKQQKEAILRHHFQKNPYYASLLGDKIPPDWNQVPIMTKSNLQLPLQQRLANGYSQKDCYVNKTSGSSGHPFVFAKDKFCHALTWASIKNLYHSVGIKIGESLEARFYGIPLDPIGHSKERLKDFFGKRVRFPIFDLSDKKLSQFLDRFRKHPFEFLNGYTSSLVLFAKYLEAQSVCLKSICPTLKVCIVTSEMLFEDDLALLQKSFGVPIYNEYGASELGVIGFAKDLQPLEIISSLLDVEILNENNEPVIPGEIGKIVITSFFNRAHPMIRYEIGDMGVLDENSTETNQKLKGLVGRTNDVAILGDGKKVPGLTFYYVTKSIIEENSPIKEFVVEQHSPDSFQIKYVSSIELTVAQKADISNSLNTYVGENLKVSFRQLDVMDRSRRGKLKQFNKLF